MERSWEALLGRKGDKSAALAFMKKALNRHASPETIVTDGLRSYPLAMRELGNGNRPRWAAGRTIERRTATCRSNDESGDARFRQMKTLQKFASVHDSMHNHFNSERHLVDN
jgi:putative transposase